MDIYNDRINSSRDFASIFNLYFLTFIDSRKF